MKSAVSVLMLVLLSTSAFALDEAIPCEKNSDCAEGMVCFEGECIPKNMELKFLGEIQDPRAILAEHSQPTPKTIVEPVPEEPEGPGGEGPDAGLLAMTAIAGVGGLVIYQNREKIKAYQNKRIKRTK